MVRFVKANGRNKATERLSISDSNLGYRTFMIGAVSLNARMSNFKIMLSSRPAASD